MKILRTIRNYLCYCGIDKDAFLSVKKDAYASNFELWRILHVLMDIVFVFLLVASFNSSVAESNRVFYIVALVYSLVVTILFFFIKKTSLFGQILVHVSVMMLFVFSSFITSNKPNSPATTFAAFLLVTPMFVIDRPFVMSIELIFASTGFLVWMSRVKSPEAMEVDLLNTIVFTLAGIFLHIVASHVRIKEFVLIRKINIQKDTDEMTGLMNKSALTRAINDYLAMPTSERGIIFLLDIDHFKSINDTFGHDAGDAVIQRLGVFLAEKFHNGEIVGRWGGDEFIIFLKDTNDLDYAGGLALELAREAAQRVEMPEGAGQLSISVGIALYQGKAKNYSELFKKADLALYDAKNHREEHFRIYQQSQEGATEPKQ